MIQLSLKIQDFIQALSIIYTIGQVKYINTNTFKIGPSPLHQVMQYNRPIVKQIPNTNLKYNTCSEIKFIK